jgi:hypothetical protein
MSDLNLNHGAADAFSARPRLDEKPHLAGAFGFIAVLVVGLASVAYSIYADISLVGDPKLTSKATLPRRFKRRFLHLPQPVNREVQV